VCLCATDPAFAAESITLTKEEAKCLVENEDRYMGAKLDPLIFVPSGCPEIPFEKLDLSMLLQASDQPETGDGAGVFLLTNKELECLYERLKELLAHNQGQPRNSNYHITLDCE
jgi:hypothetical protein